MNSKIYILFLFFYTLVPSCIAQQTETTLPKVENYTKGELELKITSFGENNPITVGKVMADGTIHLEWPEIDLSNFNENYWTTSIERFYGGSFCRNSNAVVTNETAILVETKFIYLFKYGQPVGVIIPSIQKNQEHNEDLLGSTINWIYSDSETSVKANCSENKAWEDLYNFDQTIAYDLKFKKGFNLVSNTLTAIEEWDTEKEKGSLPKTRSVQSVDQIPTNMHWHLKYWANDEELEMEQKLLKLKPISKAQFEKWLPKKAGNFKRTSYELDKALEDSDSKSNNVFVVFENGTQKMEIAVIDGARVPVELKMAKFSFAMDENYKRDDKPASDTTETDATAKGEAHHISKEDKETHSTQIMALFKDRIVLYGSGENMTAEQMWEAIKKLNVEKLIK